jgi:signal transduction histidine kinase
MLHKKLVQQLRSDSFNNIIFSTGVLGFFVVLLSFVSQEIFDNAVAKYSAFDYIKSTALFITPFLLSFLSWKISQKSNDALAAQFFIGSHIIVIIFNFALTETLTPYPIYLLGYFIVVSSTLISPQSGFTIWMACMVLVSGGLIYRGDFSSEMYVAFTPMFVNLLLALASFFTTLDWQEAVQSTSILHMRAQRRRDELFSVQEELRRSNLKQRALYTQLLTSIEVGQRITALLNLDDLLQEVANLISGKLGFAYVGIFTLESDNYLILRAQSGPSLNSEVIIKKHRLPTKNPSILTVAATEQRDVISQDVRYGEFPRHLYLSTNAQSEVGLALVVGNEMYGVLNIQSYSVNAFDDKNLPILKLLGNQVAIALKNAELFNNAVLARQEAEQANEIKSRFLANMSHELRTPLNAILNFTGFVADGVFGSINTEQVDALEKTLDSGSHLLSLINDILDLAKVEAGVMDMFIQEVDVNSLLQSTASMAKGLLKNKPVELILEIDGELPRLLADLRRLRQVLLNLVSNAVKFTREGSIKICAHREVKNIRISVQDTGIGIALDDQEIIFESFHQAQNGLNNELGTGLGLPIAKHFVEAHGGQIWLESKVDVGTTFYISLPLKIRQDTEPIPLNPVQ